jgi:hypothetical protein
MRKAFAAALLFQVMISPLLAGGFDVAPPPGNWNKVQTLPFNTNIAVELKQGEMKRWFKMNSL